MEESRYLLAGSAGSTFRPFRTYHPHRPPHYSPTCTHLIVTHQFPTLRLRRGQVRDDRRSAGGPSQCRTTPLSHNSAATRLGCVVDELTEAPFPSFSFLFVCVCVCDLPGPGELQPHPGHRLHKGARSRWVVLCASHATECADAVLWFAVDTVQRIQRPTNLQRPIAASHPLYERLRLVRPFRVL